MVKLVSVSLRVDEVDAIPDYIEKHPTFKTRHQVIKFAIRRLLFPDEKKVPVNGLITPEEESIVEEKPTPEKELPFLFTS